MRLMETLLCLDATTGQNALSQARNFKVTNVTGIVLTKLDGTAKGGIVLAIRNELHIPVKYGFGEQWMTYNHLTLKVMSTAYSLI